MTQKYRSSTLIKPYYASLKAMIFSTLAFFCLNVPLNGQLIFALSQNSLVSFNAGLPSVLMSNNTISGVAANHTLVGLDFRPATGQLYALGYNATTGEAQLYTLNTATAVATMVGTAATLATNLSRIGFDFNPTVDRIRVTAANNVNYRLHPVTGALVATDGTLAFAPGDVNAAINPTIGAVAYTNSYIGATATTLFNYDDSLNVLTTQIPPNNGTLNTIGATGILLSLTDPSGDMDIAFDPATATNTAFLCANVLGTFDALYSINLASGLATSIGLIGGGIAVSDIAVFIDRTVPVEISGQLAYALTSTNNLISFDTDAPGIIRTAVVVTGVVTGQTLVGTDFRPATGQLYALGYNATTGEAQLYTLNTATAVATMVGATSILQLGTGDIGFDFNPLVDRIRVVGANNNNYRLHPETGALLATDGILAFIAGDVNAGLEPEIGAVAYSNSFNGTSATTLYNYDNLLNVLTTQIPPNNGTLNTIGLSGITLNPADASADMDIYFDLQSGTNIAYLCANPLATNNDNLYSLSLETGLATFIDRIGNGIAVRDMAIFIDSLVVVGTEEIPGSISGFKAYPNPASTQTRLNFELGQAADVLLLATDVLGKPVSTIFNGKLSSGKFEAEWSIAGDLPGGLYFIQVYTNGAFRTSTKVFVARP